MKIERLSIAAVSLTLLLAACGSNDKQASAEQAEEAPPMMPGAMTSVVKSEMKSVDENGWYHDWNEGLAAAKSEGKPVIVDFYTDWCQWCKVMDKETFSDEEVKKILSENWIAIKVNAEAKDKKGSFKSQSLSYDQLTSAFGVRGFPSYLFINKEGEPITVVPNYWEKNKFLPILEYFQKEMYVDEVSLMDFIDSKQ